MAQLSLKALACATLGAGLLSACATPSAYPPVVNGQLAQRSGITRLSLAADAPLYVGPFSRLNAKCGLIGQARARITQAPENGTLRIIRRKSEAGFDADSPLAHCNDAKVPGTTVHYQPRKGFVGADAFTFEVVFPDGEKRVLPYEVILR
ncbi:MAG: hypothetical protein LCH39_04590 [Proteobacteria bacterium]|nr:hypothetical protein [Pseudomonadota bacterium]